MPPDDDAAASRGADDPLFVTVVMPVRDEAATIAWSLRSVLAQDWPPSRLEVVVADGGSRDGTPDLVRATAADPAANPGGVSVRVVANPAGHAAAGMNAGIAAATGSVILRLDGHAAAAPDFVRRSVEALAETGAACVGGVLETTADGAARRAVAIAMSTRFGAGSAAFRTGAGAARRDVDTVAFGACRRETLVALGGYDESFPRNQDDELNLRISRTGGRIVLDPAIRATYACRRGPLAAARQYFSYGLHKTRVLFRHGRLGSLRAFAPAALVAALAAATAVAVAGRAEPIAALGIVYGATSLAASVAAAATRRAWSSLPLVPFAYAALHLGYGTGFWCGLLRAPFDRTRPVLPFARHDARTADVAAVFARRDAEAGAAPATESATDRFLVAERAKALAKLAVIANLRGHGAPPRVLDVGCGRGTSLTTASALGAPTAHVVGVDLLPARLGTARSAAPDATLLAADAARLPFRDGAFDCACLFTTLGSIPDDDVRHRAAAEARRVVADGGTVLVWELRVARPGGDGRAVPLRALRALFPGASVTTTTAGLLPPIARAVVPFSPLAARLLAAIPFLRSHRIAVVRAAMPAAEGLPRVVEVPLAAVAALFALPVVATAAVAIAATSRGPVLHRALRAGRHGVPFSVWKLRTMRHDAPGPVLTVTDDPRVTPVGRVLRRLHIDELPQIWNILRGDMSLVGPRPEDVSLVDLADARRRRTLAVRPGIMGPAQVAWSKREGDLLAGVADVERIYLERVVPEKLACDIAYLSARTAWTDLAWIARTVLHVLTPAPPESRKAGPAT